MIEFELFLDPDGRPHFEKHSITLQDIDEVFNELDYHEQKRKDGSFISYAILTNGRHIKIIYRK